MKFFNLFGNVLKSKFNIETHDVISVNYMKVINSDEIGFVEPPPFGQSHYGSEIEYKQYLESVQSLIEEYENTGAIHSLKYNSFEDMKKNFKTQQKINDFKNSFLFCGNWINAEKTLNSKYIVCSNGRHRMYVAKKYGLKLIIHVCQEKI